jgi:GrpB-like predicted nucleotidyltransferase (UPF0157 family)
MRDPVAPDDPRIVEERRRTVVSEQFAVVCRDHLRSHPAAAVEYATVKRRCAERFRDDA